jgi:hypothetical protein
MRSVLLSLWLPSVLCAASVSVTASEAVLRSESLERVIRLGDGNVRSTSFTVGGSELLAAPAVEFSVAIAREQANRRPRGLRQNETVEPICVGGNAIRWRGDGTDYSRYDDPRPDAPKWVDERLIQTAGWSTRVGKPEPLVTRPAPGVTRLSIRAVLQRDTVLAGVAIDLHYEVYDGYPVVRKWVAVHNGGANWLRLDRMTIEDLHLAPLTRASLTPAMFGVQPSVAAFEARGGRYGVIAASEIPSALRSISEQGAMGYTPGLFEWVLGPGERFESEPVFFYGYHGGVWRTASAFSTPLDRALEGRYMEFVRRHIGIAADTAPMHGPQWMTWAHFHQNVDDKLVRSLADMASRAGFTEMLLDAGWQKGRLGTEVDRAKFPDFVATAAHIRSRGMVLGLWVSAFRDLDSRDLAAVPDGRSLPEFIRNPNRPGPAMSFASAWRDYYVKDLVETAQRYRVAYYKQDLTNTMCGDLAEGHESRTRRESLLRGVRDLLAAQRALRQTAPEIVNELTHEIYWGAPGAPADLAALKSAARYHIPPNDAPGADGRESPGRAGLSSEEHAAALRRGCWLARQRFYSHRGLPLHPLEYYGAATANHRGSLTPAVQDRQVASWLMGMPVCYSGDLRTLTDENIAHYRKRLDEIKRLQRTYGIYQRFQFSGVPEPTDVDWHWWGKLNAAGHGAVVILRGSGGAPRRAINIPWVRRDRTYRAIGLFSGKSYGRHPGAALQDNGVAVELPVYGQELLELTVPQDNSPGTSKR